MWRRQPGKNRKRKQLTAAMLNSPKPIAIFNKNIRFGRMCIDFCGAIRWCKNSESPANRKCAHCSAYCRNVSLSGRCETPQRCVCEILNCRTKAMIHSIAMVSPWANVCYMLSSFFLTQSRNAVLALSLSLSVSLYFYFLFAFSPTQFQAIQCFSSHLRNFSCSFSFRLY